MDRKIVEAVVSKARSGAEVLFARGHYGEFRIKVRYGLLHLRTRHYNVDYETWQEIRFQLKRIEGMKNE